MDSRLIHACVHCSNQICTTILHLQNDHLSVNTSICFQYNIRARVLFTLFVFVCKRARVLFTLFVFVCRRARVLFTLFVFVCRRARVLFTLFVFVCRRARVLFTLFVFVCLFVCLFADSGVQHMLFVFVCR
jgi:hypothetical protein